MDPKAAKKLEKFFDSSQKYEKRYKSLMSYLEGTPEAEQRKLFEEHYHTVFAVFQPMDTQWQSQLVKGKTPSSSALEEYSEILSLLKLCIRYLPDLMKKKWQNTAIVSLLQQLVAFENKQSIRIQGMEILLLYVEAMGDQVDDKLVELVGQALSFANLAGSFYDLKYQEIHLAADKKPICPRPDTVPKCTNEESAEMLDFFFKQIGNFDISRFGIWLDRCKRLVFSELYPLACMKIGVLGADDHSGFRPNCPTVLHKVVVEHITQWIMIAAKRDIIFSNADNVQLLLDVFEQSFSLPISMHPTIQYTINAYVFLLFSPNPPPLFQQFYQFYVESIVKQVDKVFSIPVMDDKHRDAAMSLLEQVLALNYSIAKRIKLTSPTWRVLLTTLCDSVTEALTVCSEALAASSRGGAVTGQVAPSVIPQMSEKIMETLFYLYCTSENTSENLWTHLSNQFIKHMDLKEVASQWKNSVVQLSRVVVSIVYRGVRDSKLKGRQKVAGDGDKEDAAPEVAPVAAPPVKVPSPTTYPSPQMLSILDSAISNKWTVARSDYIFHHLFTVLGNFNASRKPATHLIYITAIAESISIFQEYIDSLYGYKPDEPWPRDQPPRKLDDKDNKISFLPQDNTAIPSPCLLTFYGPVLFETCNMRDSNYAASRNKAFGLLASLVCVRRVVPLPLDILGQFYRLCFTGLSMSSQKEGCLMFEVLRYSWNLFSLRLPGCQILLLPYLRACQWVLKASFKPVVPAEVKERAMQLVCSAICTMNVYSELTLPDMQALNVRPQEGYRAVNYVNSLEGKLLIFDILKTCVKNEDQGAPPNVQVMAVWGLAILILEELVVSKTKDILLVTEGVETLLNCLGCPVEGVSSTICDALSTLAQLKSELRYFPDLLTKVILSVGTHLDDWLLDTVTGKAAKDEQIAYLFPILIEWVMILPPSVMAQTKIWKCIFRTIEHGTLYDKARENGGYEAPQISAPTPQAVAPVQLDSDAAPVQPPTPGTPGDGPRPAIVYNRIKSTNVLGDTEGSLVVVAAEHALLHLLKHFNNFPSCFGPELVTSSVSELEGVNSDGALSEAGISYFAMDGCTIMTLQELDGSLSESAMGSAVPSIEAVGPADCAEKPQLSMSDAKKPMDASKGHFVRITIRDITGKYTWDLDMAYSLEHQRYDIPKTETTPLKHPTLEFGKTDKAIVKEDKPVVPYTREQNKLPVFDASAGYNMQGVDMLEQALSYFDESDNKFIKNLAHPFNKEAFTIPALERDVKDISAVLLQQQSQESVQITSHPCRPHDIASPPVYLPPGDDAVLSYARRFLYHIGVLRHYEVNSFVKLQRNMRLIRSIRELDKITPRENQKIGIIYVKKGQEDQRDILKNDAGSPEFDAFVDGLGWRVELDSHQGFMGGLDRFGSTGKDSVYYANSFFEVMFHVVTRMPSSSTDAQQITKKRHVGNDIVHIVWSEHDIDYRTQTITSQFNDAHIILYPLPDVGLCRVAIHRKATVPFFGPLLDGMLVDRRLLPLLVRQTSMNANKYVRYKMDDYKRPYTVRRRHVTDIITRYREEQNTAEYFATLVKSDDGAKTKA